MDNSKEIFEKEWLEKYHRYVWLLAAAAFGVSFCVSFFVRQEKNLAPVFFSAFFVSLAVFLLARLVLNALLELKFIKKYNTSDEWYGFLVNLAGIAFIGTILGIYLLKV